MGWEPVKVIRNQFVGSFHFLWLDQEEIEKEKIHYETTIIWNVVPFMSPFAFLFTCFDVKWGPVRRYPAGHTPMMAYTGGR